METSQSISNANQLIFSNFQSIIDLQKINYIDFKQNQASILFSGLRARVNIFFPYERAGFSVLVNISVKKMMPYEFSFSLSKSIKIN